MDIEGQDEQEEIFPGYTSVKDFTQDGFKVLIEATRNANALPQERNFDFYNAHESFRNQMNEEGSHILRLINSIIKDQGVLGSFANRDLDEKIEVIIEANDTILERAAINLDEVNGIRKNPELTVDIQEVSAILPVSGSWNKIDNVNCTVSSFQPKNQGGKNSPNAIRLLTGNNIQRPQKFFKDRIDNSNKYPWEPRIKEKPNSLKPLAIFLVENEDGTQSYDHPYEFELDRFEPSPDQLKPIKPVVPKPLANTPLKMVETADDLAAMLEDLRKYKELAIDLEHHSYRTFLGITCLMQISTGDTDYLIDTLTLRDKLCILNEVFTKPTIVKIFHGSDHDIEWLQRDLSLYIVNMFDTFQAAKQLGYEQRSLAFLLKKFCQIDADKHFQLADWRIRPLPDELKLYAREDTHYLIYIYHKMRNELIDIGNKNPHILKSVISQSTDICKKRYVKPTLTDTSHMDLYRRCKKLFDNKQMFALKELYKWRDTMARSEDESIGYILPNHMMLQIAEILPREMQGVLACCNPIPPLVRANLLEIHKIVLKARDQSLVKPILSEESRSHGTVQTVTRLNVETALHCPHDTTNSKEFRDDLPTLLGDILKQKKINAETNTNIKPIAVNKSIVIENKKPILDVFDKIEESLKVLNKEAIRKVRRLKFLGPFERYKLVKTFVQAEEDKDELLAKCQREKSQERKVEGIIGERISIESNNGAKDVVEEKSDDFESMLHAEIKHPEVNENKHNKKHKQKKNKKSEILPLRQMTGCKRKRSPSNQPEEASDEETQRVEDIVVPLSNVRPEDRHTNWEDKRNNKKRKNKGKVNDQDAKRIKMMINELDEQSTSQTQTKNDNETTEPFYTKKQKRRFKESMEKKQRQQMQHFDGQQNTEQINEPQQNVQYKVPQQNVGQSYKQHNVHQPKKQMNQQHNQQNKNNQQQNRNNQQQNYNQQQNRNNQPQNWNQQNSNMSTSANQQNQQNRKRKFGNDQRNFKAFDYSAVDFKQFQGGAGSVNNPGNLRSNFKAKNKSKVRGRGLGKGNNKSSLFGMNSNPNRGKSR